MDPPLAVPPFEDLCMYANRSSLGLGIILLASSALISQIQARADEGSLSACAHRCGGSCSNGSCSNGSCGDESSAKCGTHRLCGVCGLSMKKLPAVANPACFGYFPTLWQVWPCPPISTEPEKVMPREVDVTQTSVKPAVYAKVSKVLKVQPAVRTLPAP